MKKLLLSILFITSLFGGKESTDFFLLISPGAISQGMGEAMVANSETSLMSYYNPAAMSFSDRNRISGSHVSWLRNIINIKAVHNTVAFNYKINEQYTIGGHYLFLDWQGTVFEDSLSYNSALAMSFAYKISNYSSIGINAKSLKYCYNYADFTNGISFDIAYYKKRDKLNIGLNLSNISSNQFSPTNLSFGTMLTLYDNTQNNIDNIKLSFQTDILLKSSYKQFEHEPIYKLGIEYSYKKDFFLRTGYFHDDARSLYFGTWGLGIRITQFKLDYAYSMGGWQNDRGHTQFFSLEYELPNK